MLKRILLLLGCLCCCSFAFAEEPLFARCAQALPTDNPAFCPSFKSVAECYCTEKMGLPKKVCQDMNAIYNRMIAMFGSVQRACQYQFDTWHSTSTQTCIDDWNCYISGGQDSQGRSCSGTGSRC